MYLYQNQSIGMELTASDTNCNVTLSLKTSNMIKMDRFWHRIKLIRLKRSLALQALAAKSGFLFPVPAPSSSLASSSAPPSASSSS